MPSSVSSQCPQRPGQSSKVSERSRWRRIRHYSGARPPTRQRTTLGHYLFAICILITFGGIPFNPAIYQWWRLGEIPSGVEENNLNHAYDLALKCFDIGDLILGAILMTISDFFGPAIMLIGAGVLVFSGLGFYLVDSPSAEVNMALLMASMIIQGGVLNVFALALYSTTTELKTYPKALSHSTRLMFLNGCYDLSTELAPVLAWTCSGPKTFEFQVCILMGLAIIVIIYGAFFLPDPAKAISSDTLPIAAQQEGRLSTNHDIHSIRSIDIEVYPTISPAVHPPQLGIPTPEVPKGFIAEIKSPVILFLLMGFFGLVTVKTFVNGSALTSAVARQFGEDSAMMTFVKHFSWIGMIGGLVYGRISDRSPGAGYLVLYSTAILSVGLLAIETPMTVCLAVVLFFLARGAIYGSMFLLMPKLLMDPYYEGRLLSVATIVAGIVLVFLVGYLNQFVTNPGALPPYDVNYRPVLWWLTVIMCMTIPCILYFTAVLIPTRIKLKQEIIKECKTF